MILAIDTSGGQCAVAVSGDGVSVVETERMDRGYANALFPMIEVAMDRAAISAQDLERVVVCTGPGSFTGLRVGISAARGLSLGCAIPGIGVTCFEVMASVMSRAGVLRLPARRGHIYVQSFDASGLPDGPPRLTDGEADPYLVDPLQLAHVGAQRTPGARPAPVYVRGPDADLPREGPPTVLD